MTVTGRTTATVAGRAYTVSMEAPRRRGDLHQSIVIARLVDELTGRPIEHGARVVSAQPGLVAKTAPGGVAGLAGVPTRALPELAAHAYAVDLSFDIDGFVEMRLPAVPIPQQVGFPDVFDDVDLGDVALRRVPVSLVVRTTTLDPQGRPMALGGATVELTGVWRRIDELTGPAAPASIVAITPGVAALRPQPATILTPVTVAPIVEPSCTLAAGVEPGTTRLDVSRRGALITGSVVTIDGGDPDRVEHIAVAQVDGPSDPESPAVIVLSFAVQRSHAAGATVERVTTTPSGLATANLTVDARPADATVFVSSTASFAGSPVVRVSGGAAPDEYVTVVPYRVVTGVDGYGRIAPLSRVAAVELTASAPGPLGAGPIPFTPRYGAPENRLDVTLE